jgi:hypothetical protein
VRRDRTKKGIDFDHPAPESFRKPGPERFTAEALLAFLAAAIIFIVAASVFGPISIVVRTTGGVELFRTPLPADASFAMRYRHSVAKLPSTEYFTADADGTIRLYRTVYKGLGAGLPFTDEGGRARIENDAIVIDGLERSFSRIPILPSPITEHRLIVGSREYDLLEAIGNGSVGVITIERTSILRLMAGYLNERASVRGSSSETTEVIP